MVHGRNVLVSAGEDEDAFQSTGGSLKKRKTVERCGPAEQANVTWL